MKNLYGVFIDADNISAEMAEKAICRLLVEGDVRFIKAYGNWSRKASHWKRIVNKYGVEATHRYNITRTKNAADISLTVDATASLYGHLDYNSLAVVSSDSDFLPLVQHAQACGRKAVGLGCQKTPVTYSQQCDVFHYIDESQVIELKAVS